MARHVIPGVAALLLAMLTGCTTVGPDYRRPADAAVDRLSAAGPFLGAAGPAFADAPVPGDWWRLYDNAVLNGLVADALAANTDLRVAAANIARAQASVDAANASREPTTALNAGAAYSRQSAEEVLRPGKPLPDSKVYSIGASVGYQVDLFGQITRTVESARADLGAAQAAHDAVRVTVVAETTRAFLEACSLGREMDVARRLVATQGRSREVTEKLSRMGRGTSVDVVRSVSQEEQVRSSLPALDAQRHAALYRIAFLTGRTPKDLPAGLDACAEEPRLRAAIPVGDGLALLRRRPDIRKAEFDLHAATARIGVVAGDLYPKVTLGASIGSAGLDKNFGAADSFKFSLGPLISWEFPDRTRVQARLRAAEADQQAALARFDASVLSALKETETTLDTYSRDLERRALLAKSRDAAGHAAEQTEQLYTLGRAGFLPVLDATRTLIAAEQALASADSKLAADQVNVFLALGGGWPQAGAPH
jgi:NodT family efflux transporter outer membrane factor (OMF) lipoprotein